MEESVSQYLRHKLGYKQNIQVIQRNQVYISSSNVSTDLVLDNDCCISRNVGRTKIRLVTSNNLYLLLIMKESIYDCINHFKYVSKKKQPLKNSCKYVRIRYRRSS